MSANEIKRDSAQMGGSRRAVTAAEKLFFVNNAGMCVESRVIVVANHDHDQTWAFYLMPNHFRVLIVKGIYEAGSDEMSLILTPASHLVGLEEG